MKGSHRIDRRLTPLGFGQIAASSCPRGASPDTMSDRSSQASPTFFPFGPQAEIRDVTFKVRHPRPKKKSVVSYLVLCDLVGVRWWREVGGTSVSVI